MICAGLSLLEASRGGPIAEAILPGGRRGEGFLGAGKRRLSGKTAPARGCLLAGRAASTFRRNPESSSHQMRSHMELPAN